LCDNTKTGNQERTTMELPHAIIASIVEQALQEDIGHGDLTTLATIPATAKATAHIVTRESGVVAGLPIVHAVFAQLDPSLTLVGQTPDGQHVQPGDVLAHIDGNARSILTGERVALNFLQRMSGIATITARYVAAIAGLPARILDTRKTTPGLRILEKYAVRMGGGVNHRYALYDAVMLKDNHLALLASHGYSIGEAVQRARATLGPTITIEVEADSLEQAIAAAEAGADMILLDNMPPTVLRQAVETIGGRAILEASGGVTLDTVRAIAETGVDYISSGALTHSVRSLDIGLDFM
jgi:nicotinate-nucleotide pyrophosphorylase (carboxylating)